MSLFAPEATDCLQEGPGLPQSGPTGWLPDHSDPSKVGLPRRLFQSEFSMTHRRMIAAFALTSGRNAEGSGGCPTDGPDG
jgi:hypothetical protein